MKTVTIHDAQHQLDRLVLEATRGEVVVLTHGKLQVTLQPNDSIPRFDPEEDSESLELELLKTVQGPHAPFSVNELRALADEALKKHRAQSKG